MAWVLRPDRLRSWAIRLGIIILILEVIYVVAANTIIRTGLLPLIVNIKPEKTSIGWDSASTYFPGFVTVSGFTLRSQTLKDQVYLRVAEADARISLLKLIFKTIHFRAVDARDVDFRYRERLDSPRGTEGEKRLQEPPPGSEYYPEIPGYSNPPDPRPEDLYPSKKKKRPWTIAISGADVEGPVRIALNEVRIEGDGSVGGGVSVEPRETIKIHRGRLELERARVQFGPEILTEDLAIHSDLRFETFPAKGARFSDVIGGASGSLSVAGRLSNKVAVSQEITPGITTFGAGTINARLEFKKGIVLDDIVDDDLSKKERKKLEAWYCDLELREGQLTLTKPLEANGQVRLKMYDTRPVVAVLKDFGNPPKWLSLMPNVKDIDGTMGVDFGKDRLAVDDLVLGGRKLEVLGWLHILDKKTDGRLYLKHGILAAGIALDQSKAKVHLSKPRKWFEEQKAPDSESDQSAGGS
jgi:hypothetical protein